MPTALVLAAASFVGRHLCARLQSGGIAYRPTSRTPRPGFLVCDLKNPDTIDAVLAATRPTWIFQCAGGTANQSAEDMTQVQVAGAAALLDSIRRHVPDAVTVLFGSAAEYGPTSQLPIAENSPANPNSPYGQSKLDQTRLAERVATQNGLRVHVVRPFNLVGPGLGSHYFAGSLCQRLRSAQLAGQTGAIPINNAHATRDWVDVRDVAEAVVLLAERPPALGSIGLYNIASGKETSLLDLANHLCRCAGDFFAVDGGAAEGRTKVDRSCGNAMRLRNATGWKPQIDWTTSLRDMWDEVRDR